MYWQIHDLFHQHYEISVYPSQPSKPMSTTRDFETIQQILQIEFSKGRCLKAFRHDIQVSITYNYKLWRQENIATTPFFKTPFWCAKHVSSTPRSHVLTCFQDTCRSMVPPLVPHGASQGQRCMPRGPKFGKIELLEGPKVKSRQP